MEDYSEVGLALTKKGVALLHSMLAVQEEQLRLDVQPLLMDATMHDVDGATGAEVWYWEQCRWHDESDDPEIKFMETLLKKLVLVDFCFIRLGFEFEDTDLRGYFWDNPFGMNVTKGIIFNNRDLCWSHNLAWVSRA